jgi:cytochrome c551/c552
MLVKCPKWNSYTHDNEKRASAKKKRPRTPSEEAPLAPASTAPDESAPVPADSVSDFEGTPDEVATLERPMGKKKAKVAHQLAMKDIAPAHFNIATKLKRNNDILDTDSQSLKVIADNGKTAAQLAIMNKDLEGLDDKQKEYFQLKRSEILSSLRLTSSSRAQS